MADYIDREDLAKHLDILYNRLCGKSPHFYCGFLTAVDLVKNFSDADVEPVRHGRWIPIRESEMTGWNPEFAGRNPIGGYECSECGKFAVFDCNDEYVLSDFCPQCGAKMDGGADNETDTVDAVPVVRCRECKYSYEDISGRCCSHGPCADWVVLDDSFCGQGERRTDNENR